MTTLTIELAPDVYELLRAEARQRGKAEHEIVEEFLVERLTGETSTTPPHPHVALAPDVQALLTQMTEGEMIVPPQGTSADAVRLLESWNAADGVDEDEEGEGTWEDVLRAVDANRAEYRKLFPDLDTRS